LEKGIFVRPSLIIKKTKKTIIAKIAGIQVHFIVTVAIELLSSIYNI